MGNTASTQNQGTTGDSILRVGGLIYRRRRRNERGLKDVPHFMAGFLAEKRDDRRGVTILMITGGPEVPDGTPFYQFEKKHGKLGEVELYHKGVIVIRLLGKARDEVSNVLLSESSQPCVPILCDGLGIRPGTPALNHVAAGQPGEKITLCGSMRLDEGTMQPMFATSGQTMGSLVTSIEGRQLLAYGPVHKRAIVNGQQTDVIALLSPALDKLGMKKGFRGKTFDFLAPIVCDEQPPPPPPPPPSCDDAASADDNLDTAGVVEESESNTTNTNTASGPGPAIEAVNGKENIPVSNNKDSGFATAAVPQTK